MQNRNTISEVIRSFGNGEIPWLKQVLNIIGKLEFRNIYFKARAKIDYWLTIKSFFMNDDNLERNFIQKFAMEIIFFTGTLSSTIYTSQKIEKFKEFFYSTWGNLMA